MRFERTHLRHSADRPQRERRDRHAMRGFGPRHDRDDRGGERPGRPDGFRGRGGPEFGRHRGRPDHDRRRGGRAPRGDVRQAVLMLLLEEPMHGYQLMQAIADRSGGRWTPSPGAIYPTIAQLEDEGLVTVEAESGRKLVTLTETGREKAQGGSDPFATWSGDAPAGANLRDLLESVAVATRQIGRHGTAPQIAAAATLLDETRRALYLVLAGAATVGETAAAEAAETAARTAADTAATAADPTEPLA